ncbi:MAG: alpha/beta fold hydrolase [Planctomycetes bacterium]|nr:alpha/beta fold hydrolase [Planctomycetota bacterium]
MPVKTVRSGDVELWTESAGDPADAPVLLIMGANASGKHWPPGFVALLAAGGRFVVRYDHRDTGRSTRRDFAAHPYAVAGLAADAVAVLDGWGLDSAHVAGLSMGGTLGQILALDHRPRLRTLTVMCTAALDVDFAGNVGRALRGEPSPDGLPTPDPAILRVLARRAEPVADRAAEVARRVEEWRALSGGELPFVEDDFRRWEEAAIDHAGSRAQPVAHAFAAPFPVSRGKELRGVTTPTLVVQGMLDPLNPPPHGRHLADLIPGARLVEITGLGHSLPTAFHRRVADLILEHTAGRP